jgi:hypothetical protein
MRQPPRTLPLWWKATNAAAPLLGRVGLLSLDLSADEFLRPSRPTRGGAPGLDGPAADHLRAFVDAFRRHGRLTFIGLQALKATVRSAIGQRAGFERQFETHPEAVRAPVPAPLFVVGFPRSGTTLLQSLLALHPGCRELRRWELEVPFPADPTSWGTAADRRFTAYESWRTRAEGRPSALNALHPDDSPEECWSGLWASFFAHEIFTVFGFHGYLAWWRGLPDDARLDAYRFYRKQLQFLGWVEPGCHWVLKSPSHMINLDALLTVFPEARVIQLHRDPAAVVSSYSSLASHLQFGLTSDWDPRAIGPQVLELLGQWAETNRAQRRRLDPDNVCDISYDDLVERPLAVVRGIYERFGMEFPAPMEQRITDWLARKHGHRRPTHAYRPEDFGLEPARIARRLAESRPGAPASRAAAGEDGAEEDAPAPFPASVQS